MRLIDADALRWYLNDCNCAENAVVGREHEYETMIRVLECIENAPTVDAEKHGHWIKVGGYVTPGGDPVWCCSECGKGLHVYGVEHNSYGSDIADHQWVACPNCGARMVNGNE